MKDTINISWKTVVIVVLVVLLFFGAFTAFFVMRSDNLKSVSSDSLDSSQDKIPEKCRLPVGEDVNSWKEHLGHHAETQECLNYFNQ